MVSQSEIRDGAVLSTPDLPPTRCRNCGHEVFHQYCPKCGQHCRDHNISIWQFFREFLQEFAQWDSKFFRTMGPLVLKPGFLTSEWVKGKRVRYITPLKIYVTLSAIGFLVMGIALSLDSSHVGHSILTVNGDRGEALKSLVVQPTDSPFEALVKKRAAVLANENPKIFLDHCISHLPTASLLTIPIAAFLIMLLYLRRRRYYVEHLVFMLHYNAFCFLLLTVMIVAQNGLVGFVAFCWAAGYLLLAMKRSYGQGWIKTIFKFGFFSFAYTILLSLAAAATVLVSFFMATEDPPMTMPALSIAQQKTAPPSHTPTRP